MYVCLNKLVPQEIWLYFQQKLMLTYRNYFIDKIDDFSKCWQKWWFCKIWLKLMIFQILAKIDNFSNICQNNGIILWNLAKTDDFSNFGKNDVFLKFSQNWASSYMGRIIHRWSVYKTDGVLIKQMICLFNRWSVYKTDDLFI